MDREQFIHWLERIYGTAESEIDCEQLQALLPAFVELKLAGGEAAPRFSGVLAHLAQCPDCAEEFEGLRKVSELETRGRLPHAEESLSYFQDKATPEPDEIVPVSSTEPYKVPTSAP